MSVQQYGNGNAASPFVLFRDMPRRYQQFEHALKHPGDTVLAPLSDVNTAAAVKAAADAEERVAAEAACRC
jgi:hypothetical protein